ncbi:hypothetical protein SDC9_49854 [bioreactor metagenome]|uniref:Uncharacterized protein n=1 Tax=bioreactor metagenome TaxID=1076179 RepID=A0A644WJ36_9ZZZZ
MFSLDFFFMNIFLQSQQNLTGIYRFGEIIGNFAANSHIHEIFLLTFRNHDQGHIRMNFLNQRNGFQSAQTRHVFIQEDDVKTFFFTQIHRIFAIGCRNHLISFFFQKKHIDFQQVNFIISP